MLTFVTDRPLGFSEDELADLARVGQRLSITADRHNQWRITHNLLCAYLGANTGQLGLLSPMMATTSYWLGGAILLAAGVWQLTPIKGICLRHCRSPMGFLVRSWRSGRLGAFRMGLEHGSYCLGCCWFLDRKASA
jgi:predicted metal-binding membrane protein